MEEEQNKAKEVLDEVVKKEVNKVKRSIWRKILPILLRVIAVLLIVLLIFGLVYAVVESVLSVIRGISSTDENSFASFEQETSALVSLSDDGRNYILNEDAIAEIIENLKKGALNTNASGFTYSEKNSRDSDGNLKEDMIRKYVKTEVISMLPKIGSKDIDGIINIYRDDGGANSSAKSLKYTPYADFKEYVDSNSENALDYFSLKPETFELCYATSSITVIKDKDGNQIDSEITITSYETNYQSSLQGYIMPISFLVSTHFLAQNEEFMNELMELQTKDSYIDLTLKDTVSIYTTIVDYTGDIHQKIDEYAEYTAEVEEESDSRSHTKESARSITIARQVEGTTTKPTNTTKKTNTINNTNTSTTEETEKTTKTISGSAVAEPRYENQEGAIDNSNIGNYYEEARPHETVFTNISTQLTITKADTWIATKENTYTKTVDQMNQPEQTNNINIPSDNINEYKKIGTETFEPPSSDQISQNVKDRIEHNGYDDYEVTKLEVTTNERYAIKEIINETNSYTTYTEVNNETSLENVDKIIDLLNKKEYGQVKNNVTTAPEFYFELLSRDEKTQDVEQVMRYVIYKLTGKSYGVTKLDNLLDKYKTTTFYNATGGIYGGRIQEKVWFALKDAGASDVAAAGAMGNIDYESGGMIPGAVEGGYNEFNGGIGICQWTNNNRGSEGRNTQLRLYAQSKGVEWQDEDTQVEFLIAELTGSGPAAGYATYQFMTKSYSGVTYQKTAWINIDEDQSKIDYATKAFAACFERPNESAFSASMTERISRAQNYYNEFKGKTKSEGYSIVEEALKYVGNPYLWGGSSLISGCDCSHFVWLIYKACGIISSNAEYISTSAFDSKISNWGGTKIGTDPNLAEPGDIIIYRPGNIHHAAIYMGNGLIVEAQSSRTGITSNRTLTHEAISGIYRVKK